MNSAAACAAPCASIGCTQGMAHPEACRKTSPLPGPRRRSISISNCASFTTATITRSRVIPRRLMSGLRIRPAAPRPGGGWGGPRPRPDSPYHSARFGLHGLEASASYRVTNLDSKQQVTYPGTALMRDGLEVSLQAKQGSALLLYERQ